MTRDASVQLKIANTCDEIKSLLLEKNAKYGNSALDPVRIFSRASAEEQILVRIDDKLSRIMHGIGLAADDEDVINGNPKLLMFFCLNHYQKKYH